MRKLLFTAASAKFQSEQNTKCKTTTNKDTATLRYEYGEIQVTAALCLQKLNFNGQINAMKKYGYAVFSWF